MKHPVPTLMAPLAMFMALAASAADFELASPDISDGAPIDTTFVYNGAGCRGRNQSPALTWRGAPAGTRSFAVTVYDPDAPTGHGWWHWAVANIPPSVTRLARGSGAVGGSALPETAVQLRNDFGNASYGGPCPPPADSAHHYEFRVYAVDVPHLRLDNGDGASALASALQGHTLGVAKIVATYDR